MAMDAILATIVIVISGRAIIVIDIETVKTTISLTAGPISPTSSSLLRS